MSTLDQPTAVADQAPTAKPQFKRNQAVEGLRRALADADAGTLAALRRALPASPPASFYRVTVGILDDLLPESGKLRDLVEARWVVVVSAMARATPGLLAPVPLGQAIALAGVAEMRLLRLLEAHDEQLADIVRNVVHQLVQKGQPFDPKDLADLVLYDGTEHEKATRRRVARDFYRHEGK